MSDKLVLLNTFAGISEAVKRFFAEKPKNIVVGFYADAHADLAQLDADIQALRDEAAVILAAVEKEQREPDADEEAIAAEIEAKVQMLEKRRRFKALALGNSAPRSPAPAPTSAPQANRRTTPTTPQSPTPVQAGHLDRNALGDGEYFMAARQLKLGNNTEMARKLELHMQTSTYANEAVGSEGGFLVPADIRREIWQKVTGNDLSLLQRVDQFVTQLNAVEIPTDETTPWGTAGVQSYWGEEGGVISESKPKFGYASLRLNKLTALVPVTEEMMQDAPLIDSYIRSRVPQTMDSRINEAIFRGDGVGKPKGLLNSAATVVVAAEGGQPADTIVYANIVKMWSRMAPQCRRNAVWLVSQQAEQQLMQLAFVAGAASPVPAYMPAGGLSSEPFGTLMGRPVLPMQDASALGDKGDIVLADLSQYLVATRGAIRTDTSMHFYFNQDATAIRFVFRLAGQPWWGGPIVQKNSPDTLSCFVTLADRA